MKNFTDRLIYHSKKRNNLGTKMLEKIMNYMFVMYIFLIHKKLRMVLHVGENYESYFYRNMIPVCFANMILISLVRFRDWRWCARTHDVSRYQLCSLHMYNIKFQKLCFSSFEWFCRGHREPFDDFPFLLALLELGFCGSLLWIQTQQHQ